MHEQFMLAALSQAQLGRGMCAPNPAVGAVAVLNGKIIAQAFHSGAGSAHAEQKLLALLPESCADITIYVTLEPCNHWGRTPPCVDALIAKHVARVVYAYRDPNPVVAEKDTPSRLSAHGIEVCYLPLPEIDAFYESYTHWVKTKLPWVTVKMAQSFDGKIAGSSGQVVRLSNAACFTLTHHLRAATDVILTTARTVNQDNPAMNVRDLDQQVIQTKTVAVIDRLGCLNPQAQLLTTAKDCILYHSISDVKQVTHATYYQMPCVQEQMDLLAILRHLGTLGYHDVLVEAGAELFQALHQARLVNRTYLYLVPRVLGPDALSLYATDIFAQTYQMTWREMGDNMVARVDWQ